VVYGGAGGRRTCSTMWVKGVGKREGRCDDNFSHDNGNATCQPLEVWRSPIGRFLSPLGLMSRRASARFVVLFLVVGAAVAEGQSPSDLIRGRVTDDSAKVVVGASVFVTRGPDRALKQTTTDSAGRYAITFEDGTGDYLVAVTALGYKTARRRVQRQGSERELVADFVLGRDMSLLAAVKVTATQPVRATNRVSPYNPETGASEKWSDGLPGQLPPSVGGHWTPVGGALGRTWGGRGGLDGAGPPEDGPKAIAGLPSRPTDALILDLQLPSGSGLQVLRAVRERLPHMRVIVMTNFAAEPYRKAAMAAGAEIFLDKSAEFGRVRDILSGWRDEADCARVH